jgi:hypothetical protein
MGYVLYPLNSFIRMGSLRSKLHDKEHHESMDILPHVKKTNKPEINHHDGWTDNLNC